MNSTTIGTGWCGRGGVTAALAVVTLLTAVSASGAAGADEGKATASDEVKINAGGDSPAVALRGADRVAVAWTEAGDIRARLFRGAAPLTAAFRVNPQPTGDLAEPQVGMDANGNFMIVWQGGDPTRQSPPGGDGGGTGIFAQRFRASGARRDGVFRVNDTVAQNQLHPRIGVAPGGNFAVLWEDRVPDGHGGLRSGVRVAPYAASGARLGKPLTLGAEGSSNLSGGVGAWDDGFAAGWTEVDPCGGGALDVESAVASYDWSVAGLGLARVSDGQSCDEQGPTMLALPGSQYGPAGVYLGRRYTIQRYSSSTGEALTERPTIAELPACSSAACERIAAAAGDGRGRIVAIWETRTARSGGGNDYQLTAQLFGKDGKARSAKIPVTVAPSSAVEHPAAALTANGHLVVTWKRTGADAATSGLFLRTFLLP